ncbi:MAG: hypothetical protein Kow00109_15210 [Acidobacteriota bacterium]
MRNLLISLSILAGLAAFVAAQEAGREPAADPARQVIQRAVEAMGGDAYLNMDRTYSRGRYFTFRRGRKGFARYQDWTMYRPAVKWRFQLGEGKRSSIRIIDLEAGKGWLLEGKSSIEELPAEEIEDFARGVKQDLDVLLRERVDEPGMSLFYYGPDEVAGEGEYEAVEFIDEENLSVVVFFDRETHRPEKLETSFRDKQGFRHKQEVELSNWHTIQGVTLPLRVDVYVDEEISSQRFVEELQVNPKFPAGVFEPKRLDD